jgi:hypothetical protein
MSHAGIAFSIADCRLRIAELMNLNAYVFQDNPQSEIRNYRIWIPNCDE